MSTKKLNIAGLETPSTVEFTEDYKKLATDPHKILDEIKLLETMHAKSLWLIGMRCKKIYDLYNDKSLKDINNKPYSSFEKVCEDYIEYSYKRTKQLIKYYETFDSNLIKQLHSLDESKRIEIANTDDTTREKIIDFVKSHKGDFTFREIKKLVREAKSSDGSPIKDKANQPKKTEIPSNNPIKNDNNHLDELRKTMYSINTENDPKKLIYLLNLLIDESKDYIEHLNKNVP